MRLSRDAREGDHGERRDPRGAPPGRVGERDLVEGALRTTRQSLTRSSSGSWGVYLLPTGYACALEEPPQGALATLLHSMILLAAGWQDLVPQTGGRDGRAAAAASPRGAANRLRPCRGSVAAYTGPANLSQPPPRARFEARLRGSGRTATRHGLAAGNRRRGPRVIGPASHTAPPSPARARTSERFRARGGEASPGGPPDVILHVRRPR